MYAKLTFRNFDFIFFEEFQKSILFAYKNLWCVPQ